MQFLRLTSFLCCSALILSVAGRSVSAVDDDSENYETFTVDAVHSSVLFRVTHMGVGPFWGRFGTVKGSVDISKDNSTIFVHTLDIDDSDNVRESIRRGLEEPVKRAFE